MLVMLFSSWGLLSPSTSASGFADGIDAVKEVGGLSQKEVQPTNLVTTGLYWLMYGIGIISVVMIIIGGIRYATSGGNAEKVKSAKNTILYAVVGLAVALLALAIVNFVNTTVNPDTTPTTPPGKMGNPPQGGTNGGTIPQPHQSFL